MSIPSLGPTTLFSHSNCLFTLAETSVRSAAAFLFLPAWAAVAPVAIRSASAADDANLSCIWGSSAVGVLRLSLTQPAGNHIVVQIINTYT